MSIEHVILGLLQKPLSGYDIKQHFDRMISHFWAAEQSQIYRTLKKLEQKGLLKSKVEPSERGPDRKVYSLTPAGRKSLQEWLRNEPIFGDERYAFVAQLCFMGELEDLGQTLSFVRQLKEMQEETLAELQGCDAAFRECEPDYPDDLPHREYHFALTLDMGIALAKAKIRWCNQVIKRVEARLERETE
ncbi:MAG: PadR family transcriptional regulator [Gemmatimonadetes bacterium]|jgi:PadR family transcriptional regulator, regulatory protein AphA|nr:PadR family transcriptional regulator [Gemmatimonadota bacterium]